VKNEGNLERKPLVQDFASIEEFKSSFFENIDDKTVIDSTADKYDKIPSYLKILKNFDPTGIISLIDDVLSENRAKREQERIIEALYYMFQKIRIHEVVLRESIGCQQEQLYVLTEKYFENCKESYDKEKVRYFSQVWLTGIIDKENTIDEKIYVFKVISSLSIDQIHVLKYLYDKVDSYFNNDLKQKGSANKRPYGIKGYAEENSMDYAYVQQICIDMQGKGLLFPGAETMLSGQAHYFMPTDYIDTLIKYI
jgi:hypothetical protein